MSKVFGKCSCCDCETKKAAGSVYLKDGSETLYIARWTVQGPGHGIAFLILIPGTGTYVSVLYSFESNAFRVVGEDGCDWHFSNHAVRILDRNEVMGTPLVERVFAYLDEIWMHDRELRSFHEQPTKC